MVIFFKLQQIISIVTPNKSDSVVHTIDKYINELVPLDTRRKMDVHNTSRTSSERHTYVQFTSCA